MSTSACLAADPCMDAIRMLESAARKLRKLHATRQSSAGNVISLPEEYTAIMANVYAATARLEATNR